MAPLVLHLLFVTLVLLAKTQVSLQQLPSYNTTIRIDCGGSTDFVSQLNETWLSDRFYTGGSTAQVLNANSITRSQERSLRYFPVSNGKKSCYIVQVPKGRYSIRMFFIYGNYDQKSQPPSFDVSVEGTVVFSWRYPWSEEEAKAGVYSDLYAFVDDGAATICFYSIATDSPVIGALEISQVDPRSYNSLVTGRDVILVNYGRFSGGHSPFGAGVTIDSDKGLRAWEPDQAVASPTGNVDYLVTSASIKNSNSAPDYFPERLYQSARTLSSPGNIEYLFTVDSSLDYLLWFHFAEIDSLVHAAGQRVFDVFVNNDVAFSSIDVFGEVGKFSAYDLAYTIKNLTGSVLNITLAPRVGTPMICGLENYAILQMDTSTDIKEALAMMALKESLMVPERMGWNGDPCAPYNWNTWEGVTCNLALDNKSLVITRLDLSSQGLKGTIDDRISMLTHLISLNLSNNNLKGSIPAGLGNHNLQIVDLSYNELTGSIPDTLGASHVDRVKLNNNQLEGQVPLSLYAIGVRGGFINISSNKALCGVPALPDCPFFWQKQGLSVRAKAGIGFAAAVAFVLLLSAVYLYIQKRRQNDYNFGLPRQIASRSMRYQKQKSRLKGDIDENERTTKSKFGFASNLNPL